MATLRDQSLTDQDDQDHAALQPAYRTVTLANLDSSGLLRGDHAYVVNATASSPTHEYEFTRDLDAFEETMAYHHVTVAQTYIQSLGFTHVNNEPQDLVPNGYTGDNSSYSPVTDAITLGSGGVDDAEDADITWHELGRAIQDDQVPSFGIGHDAGSIGEGGRRDLVAGALGREPPSRKEDRRHHHPGGAVLVRARHVVRGGGRRNGRGARALFGRDTARTVRRAFRARGIR